MLRRDTTRGFTITEMVVGIAVMSVFLMLFFQVYMTNVSQQRAVSYRAAAFNTASSNLNKISSKIGLPPCTAAIDMLASPNTAGAVIASNAASTPRTWAQAAAAIGTATEGISPEVISNGILPNGTIQELRVAYPQGCAPEAPVKIVSIVTYGSESVRRAAYVN